MSLRIVKGVEKSAQLAVIYGPPGVGKSSLAGQFPAPVFFDCERSTGALDVTRVHVEHWNTLRSGIVDLTADASGYQTAVIDTADWAEKLAGEWVCEKGKKTSLEDWDYGRGYVFLAEEWAKLLKDLRKLVASGMHVVILAHSQVKSYSPPDGDAYDRYALKLHSTKNKATDINGLTREAADHLLFYNYEVTTTQTKTGTKAEGGSHVLYAQFHPAWDAKNRAGLAARMMPAAETPQDAYACIASAFTIATKAPAAKPAAAAKPIAADPDALPMDFPKKEEPEDVKYPEDKAAWPVELWEQMERTGITEADMKLYITQHMVPKKMVVADQTPANFHPTLVTKLIGAWDRVTARIDTLKQENAA